MRLGIIGPGLLLVLLLPAAPAAAQEQPVDLELVLAVDVSRSMDQDELALQRDGYVDALTHPEVIAAIASGITGRIAIAYVEWAGDGSQAVILPWRLIDGPAAARTAAADLAEASVAETRRHLDLLGPAVLRRAVRPTASGHAPYDRRLRRRPNNAGAPVTAARDAVLSRGISINGLPVILKRGLFGSLPEPEMLDAYYRDCVIGGPGAFTVPVRSPVRRGSGASWCRNRRRGADRDAGGLRPAQAGSPTPSARRAGRPREMR
ncbi:MAG: DUF1194 domain-containing protein [Dongiaceae bacterium]